MLKKLILENWKSFRYAELPIDPLTILIGTNASGKSNAIEALEFLSRILRGMNVETALLGDNNTSGIRGGLDWAAFKPESSFTLKLLIQGENEFIDYLYSITVSTIDLCISTESLIRVENASHIQESIRQTTIFQTNYSHLQIKYLDLPVLPYSFPDTSSLGVDSNRSKVVFSAHIINPTTSVLLSVFPLLQSNRLDNANYSFLSSLFRIYFLDPIPSKMRTFASISSTLKPDASNVAGVLAALSNQEQRAVEAKLSEYVKYLPEQDIKRVWAEPVGRLESDAMLYCEESWFPNQPEFVVDARGMSDGTLRFIAILAALLTLPERSQLVIEEIDNGLHPSRADLLLRMLKEIGVERQIDILITTHNPALLDALEPEEIPFVVVAHRDAKTGESKLTPLDDLSNLPKLLASGSLGKLSERGAIERSLSKSE